MKQQIFLSVFFAVFSLDVVAMNSSIGVQFPFEINLIEETDVFAELRKLDVAEMGACEIPPVVNLRQDSELVVKITNFIIKVQGAIEENKFDEAYELLNEADRFKEEITNSFLKLQYDSIVQITQLLIQAHRFIYNSDFTKALSLVKKSHDLYKLIFLGNDKFDFLLETILGLEQELISKPAQKKNNCLQDAYLFIQYAAKEDSEVCKIAREYIEPVLVAFKTPTQDFTDELIENTRNYLVEAKEASVKMSNHVLAEQIRLAIKVIFCAFQAQSALYFYGSNHPLIKQWLDKALDVMHQLNPHDVYTY